MRGSDRPILSPLWETGSATGRRRCSGWGVHRDGPHSSECRYRYSSPELPLWRLGQPHSHFAATKGDDHVVFRTVVLPADRDLALNVRHRQRAAPEGTPVI